MSLPPNSPAASRPITSRERRKAIGRSTSYSAATSWPSADAHPSASKRRANPSIRSSKTSSPMHRQASQKPPSARTARPSILKRHAERNRAAIERSLATVRGGDTGRVLTASHVPAACGGLSGIAVWVARSTRAVEPGSRGACSSGQSEVDGCGRSCVLGGSNQSWTSRRYARSSGARAAGFVDLPIIRISSIDAGSFAVSSRSTFSDSASVDRATG